MALLEDPTIQRILDEVNKAATGGILGQAGNYIPESMPNQPVYQPIKPEVFPQQQAPMFYPTPEMFNINGIGHIDPNMTFPTVDSLNKSTDFDLYGPSMYDAMAPNLISPYESYKQEMFNNYRPTATHSMRTTSIVSSTNNEILSDNHRHSEYPTIPPTISATVPNLGLDLRQTPSVDHIPMTLPETEPIDFPIDTLQGNSNDIGTASIELVADKEENNSSMHENEETDRPHLSSAGRIFYDPNPQIIQRKGSNSVTYKQNIIVRFLQPPPVQNAGPLIIKEVSSQQQQPTLPPLVIKQRPTPPKTPPPLIIREKPPPLPSSLSTKVITRHLPPEPAPPRAVIIERLPPLPPKPRDIIIERWLPYEILNQKRKVVIERVQKNNKDQPQPKNVIITYEPVHAKIERNFLKQNVIREDPQEYLNRFGAQLFDSEEVLRQARAAGVLEDLNPPISFIRPAAAMTSNASIATDNENSHPVVKDYPNEQQNGVEKTVQEIHEEIHQPNTRSTEEITQDEDVFVEENVTPLYMNSGENLEETLHRLGIELPKNQINDEHSF